MSTPLATPITRFDYRVRIAAALLRSARRGERLVVTGMVLTSAAAAWPLGGVPVAVPALLALAALIRHHVDGLGARRDALTAAGANPADTRVIQSTGPLGAAGLGALIGSIADIALGRPPAHALLPVAGAVAALLIRRAWLGAPALAAGATAALLAGAVVRATSVAPAVRSRSRLDTGHVAAAHAATATWPVLLAAVLVPAATQAAIVHRHRLRRLAHRLTARSGA